MTKTKALPDPSTLNGDQLRGWACALCGARLYADRPLGIATLVREKSTEDVELWACAPSCPSRPCGPGERARYH
ncbi:hypothetical protein [Streptomyces sp. MZ04]|uniref:hypothetical protein n=1 Tax=Streptomyces sp. MZ04 TaxID=2559236 RepID=UPI00107ED69F|nr:hypothetical protein [Streptomyces sp. MZ04]TGA88446.1 hypothetical protein E2651_40030 [Streptomyces sp. MZ04]